MKKYFFIFLILLLSYSCREKEYKYKICGYTQINGKFHYSIAYTDTIYGKTKDYIWFLNKNGVKVTILNPYKIIKIK